MVENAITIDKELRTKTVALELFNTILKYKAPTQVVAMNDRDFFKLYRDCFQIMSLLEMPGKSPTIPHTADPDDEY